MTKLLAILILMILAAAGPMTMAVCYAECATKCGLVGVAVTPIGGAVCYAAC